MRHKSLFWGVFLLAAGLFVITSQFGYFAHLGFWSIAVTVLLAAAFIGGLSNCDFFGIFIPLALLYLIYDRPLHLPVIPAWPLLLGAVLLAVGCHIIFPGWHGGRWRRRHADYASESRGSFSHTSEHTDGNTAFVRASFSQAIKYLHADSLKKADMVSSFGSLRVYFDQVTLDPNGAEVNVDVSFGEMTLYMPRAWQVINHVETSLGVIHDDGRNNPSDSGTQRLSLTGRVAFGSLQICYI